MNEPWPAHSSNADRSPGAAVTKEARASPATACADVAKVRRAGYVGEPVSVASGLYVHRATNLVSSSF